MHRLFRKFSAVVIHCVVFSLLGGCSCTPVLLAAPDAGSTAPDGGPECVLPEITQPVEGAIVAAGPVSVWLAREATGVRVRICADPPECGRWGAELAVFRTRAILGELGDGSVTVRAERGSCTSEPRTFYVSSARDEHDIDIDGDGLEDVVAADGEGAVLRYLLGSEGRAREHQMEGIAIVGGPGALVASQDVDGDGVDDVLAAGPEGVISFRWDATRGALVASAAVEVAGATRIDAAGDVDLDGYGDALVSTGSCSFAMIWGGRPIPRTSAFTPAVVPCDEALWTEARPLGRHGVDDFPDVVQFTRGSRNGVIYWGSTIGLLLDEPRVFAIPEEDGGILDIRGLDVDGDGWRDLAVLTRGASGDGLRILYGDEGRFSASRSFFTTLSSPSNGSLADLGDLDGDRSDEIAISGLGIYWLVSIDEAGEIELAEVHGATGDDVFGREVAGVGDLTSDGRADLVVTSMDGARIDSLAPLGTLGSTYLATRPSAGLTFAARGPR